MKIHGLNQDLQFEFDGSPMSWERIAFELWQDANEIEGPVVFSTEDEHGLPVAYDTLRRGQALLFSCALEAQIKAVYVAKNPDCLADGKVQSPVNTHGLVELLDHLMASKSSKRQKQTCETASAIITGYGRYPVSTNKHTHRKDYPSYIPASFKSDVLTLCEHLHEMLEGALENPWRGPAGVVMSRPRRYGDNR